MFKGRGKLRIGAQVWDMEPGDAVLICPGDWHLYGGVGEEGYFEDAIRFCGRVPDFMRKSGILHSGKLHLGKVRKLIPLVEQLRSPSPQAAITFGSCLRYSPVTDGKFVENHSSFSCEPLVERH